jgi:hypothetical protein
VQLVPFPFHPRDFNAVPSRDEHRAPHLEPHPRHPSGPTRSANHHVASSTTREGRAIRSGQGVDTDGFARSSLTAALILRRQPAIRRLTRSAPSDSKCVFSRAHSMLSPRFSTVFQKESRLQLQALREYVARHPCPQSSTPAASVRKTFPKSASANRANTTPYLPSVYCSTNISEHLGSAGRR